MLDNPIYKAPKALASEALVKTVKMGVHMCVHVADSPALNQLFLIFTHITGQSSSNR